MSASSASKAARTAEIAHTSSGPSAGRWLGIRIQVDWSLLIVFALVLVNLGVGVFPAWHPNWSPAMTWTIAGAAAVLFFLSVLVHEISHALVARAYGIPVRGITLFLFGGVTQLEGEPSSPRSEFWMAFVGPLTSALIGVLALWAGAALAGNVLVLDPTTSDATTLSESMHLIGPVATLLLWLGPINLMLAFFNVLPGFPMDGGRVLRSLLWWATGDLLKATRWASGVGQVFAWLLMAFGVVNMFGGMFGQGVWLVLIGWFLNSAARASYQQLNAKHALHGVPVSKLMSTHLGHVTPDLTLDRFVSEQLLGSDQSAFAVERDGELVGLVGFDDVRAVPQHAWPTKRVSDIMAPRESLALLPPDAPAERALEELGERDTDQIPVVEGTHLQGVVRRRDLVRWLALHGQAGHA